MKRALASSLCLVAAAAAAYGLTQVTVGGKEKQALYPFRCC